MNMHDRIFEFDVESELEFVWDALTTADGLATWYVLAANVEARPGGTLSVDWGTGDVAMGTFEVFEAPTRLRLVYAPDADLPGAEEWLLSHENGITHVRLVHSLPVDDESTWDDTYPGIVRGWALFFATLQYAAHRVGRLGRQSEVRLGDVAENPWPRVLGALGLHATPPVGSTVEVAGRTAEVLAAFDGFSLLLAIEAEATLLIDLEGPMLYALSATYGTAEQGELAAELVRFAEAACDAAGNA